jgi:hypothetical protein
LIEPMSTEVSNIHTKTIKFTYSTIQLIL